MSCCLFQVRYKTRGYIPSYSSKFETVSVHLKQSPGTPPKKTARLLGAGGFREFDSGMTSPIPPPVAGDDQKRRMRTNGSWLRSNPRLGGFKHETRVFGKRRRHPLPAGNTTECVSSSARRAGEFWQSPAVSASADSVNGRRLLGVKSAAQCCRRQSWVVPFARMLRTLPGGFG